MPHRTDITLPDSWAALSQRRLREAYTLMAAGTLGIGDIQVLLALHWSGLRPVKPKEKILRLGKEILEFDSAELGCLAGLLQWIREPPGAPIRLDRLGSWQARTPDLRDLTFGQYLTLDNLYQGFLHTRDPSLLDSMAETLYRPGRAWIASRANVRTAIAHVNVFQWWTSWKLWASRRWDTILRPVQGTGKPSPYMIRKTTDAQIRALTRGDVSKEAEILAAPLHRALTELDALAREYEELRRITGKK